MTALTEPMPELAAVPDMSMMSRQPYVSVILDVSGSARTISTQIHGPDVTEREVAGALLNSTLAACGLEGPGLYTAMLAEIAAFTAPAPVLRDAPEPAPQEPAEKNPAGETAVDELPAEPEQPAEPGTDEPKDPAAADDSATEPDLPDGQEQPATDGPRRRR